MVKAMILKFTLRLFWIISYAVLQKFCEYFYLKIFNGSFNSPCKYLENISRLGSKKLNCCVFLLYQMLFVDKTMIFASMESRGFILSRDIIFEKKRYCVLISPRPCKRGIFAPPKFNVNSRYR